MTRDEIIGGFEREIRRIRREPKEKMLGVCITVDEAEEIVELLKEQEAVEPINSHGTLRCGNCNNIVGYNDGNGRGYQNNYCSCCGRLVKLE